MIRKRQSEKSEKRFKIAMRGCLLAIALGLLPVAALRAQTRTTVTDTIHGPDGSLPGGQIVISSKSTFTASDGTVVFSGVVATATVTEGSFSVSLVPNAGSNPSGTSYTAIYKLAGVPYREETWVVPASAAPVDLSVVRSLPLSGPTQTLSSSQMPALSGAVTSPAGSTVTTIAPAITTALTDKGGQVFNVKAYGAVGDGVTDDTTAVNEAFAAAYAAGGGVIFFPHGVYVISGALVIPNDGQANPRQPTYRMTGVGMGANGWWATPSNYGSRLILTETSNTVAKIDTRGAGYMEIDHLALKDTASDSVPFIQTTNTTLHVHQVSFTSSQTDVSNVQDAIVLGGTNTANIRTGAGDAPFQGYGTRIWGCFFAQVRHAVAMNAFANGIQILDNTIGQGSGSSTVGDAPFVSNGAGTGGNANSGNYIAGNLIEETSYYYGIRLHNSENFTLMGNSGFDGGANTVADVYLDSGADTETISCGQTATNICVDPASPGYLATNNVNVLSSVGGQVGNFFKLVSAQVPVNDCFWLGGTSGECVYGSGGNVYFRYQYDNSTDMILTSLGWLGILNTFPYVPLDVNGAMRTRPVAFASAPGCNSNTEGAMIAISDSTVNTWGATIAGSGTNHVLAYCNGSNWTVAAK